MYSLCLLRGRELFYVYRLNHGIEDLILFEGMGSRLDMEEDIRLLNGIEILLVF